MPSYVGRSARVSGRARGRYVVGPVCLGLALCACGDSRSRISGDDASVQPKPEAGVDSGGKIERDGGLDAGAGALDGGLDAGADALDGGLDAGAAALDSGLDADAAPDADEPDPAPTFTDVYAILSEKCAFCHVQAPPTGTNPAEGDTYPKIGFALGRLDMSTRELAYRNLVGPSGQGVAADGIHCGPDESPQGYTRVMPGNTATSLILSKLSPNPVCGVRMPDNLPELPDVEIATIAAWIAGGALNN